MRIHAANAERSERLRKVLHVFRNSGGSASGREIARGANVLSPATCVSELRASGHVIECKYGFTTDSGAKVYMYRYLGKR